ncbi:MAG: hypothetical protein P1S60_09365 [Anaerolineae bacterium]|nr:hypothetical protein [Anaerolineae bacterium]
MEKRFTHIYSIALLLMGIFTTPILAAQGHTREEVDPDYAQVIRDTANMVWDDAALRLAAEYDLDIINVTWEDTGRYYGSSVGPNISDVTIQVQNWNPELRAFDLTLMPVIRYPNFSDLTADISPDDFYLLVGNEDGVPLYRVTLAEYLRNFRRYMSDPGSWDGMETSLLASRDSHVLVSAQAAFLPIPENGTAEFNPVIFNYQSYQQNPAVLTIIATREGTSATIIDNVRDGFSDGYSWGQRLFFNQKGERASFTGQRISDFLSDDSTVLPVRPGDTPVQPVGESGLNMVLLIQVPLKQKRPMRFIMGAAPVVEGEMTLGIAADEEKSDVEAAVIGHGPVEGPYTEVDGLDIERDPRFPIRVTVQFYKATSNGVVSEQDMADIAAQIEKVYDNADYVGSLVVDGPSDRPTEYDGPKMQPAEWWQVFWERFTENTGLAPEEAMELLRKLRALAWR